MLSIYSSTCNPLYPQSTLVTPCIHKVLLHSTFQRYDEHICVWESPYRGFLTQWKSKYSKPIVCFLLILHRHISHSKRWNQNPTNLPLTVPLSMNSEKLMHAKQSIKYLKRFMMLVCLCSNFQVEQLQRINIFTIYTKWISQVYVNIIGCPIPFYLV